MSKNPRVRVDSKNHLKAATGKSKTRQQRKPTTLTREQVVNPRYAGATPEMVGRALLKHKP